MYLPIKPTFSDDFDKSYTIILCLLLPVAKTKYLFSDFKLTDPMAKN